MQQYRNDKQTPKILTAVCLLYASTGNASGIFSEQKSRNAPHEEAWENPALDALGEAIQDEYRAHETYKQVLAKFGDVLPFANIVQAEAKHIEALTKLYRSRGLDIPKSQWSALNVPKYRTVQEACTAGIDSEILNINMYKRLLLLELPSDMRFVFNNLQSASQENHLPAFRRCSG